MIVSMDHPLIESGGAKLIASPIRLSETPVEYHRHPPLLGEHTTEILKEKLGMDDKKIKELKSEGIIG